MRNCILIGLLLISINLFSQNKTNTAERYFGLHFDFHADTNTIDVGKYMNQAEIEKMLADVKPDYLQVDCKGHKGICSYPTKVGTPSTNFIKDPMRIWRDATKKYNIPLYVHYSGVWDKACAWKHPSWVRLDENGKVDKEGKMSVFGPYGENNSPTVMTSDEIPAIGKLNIELNLTKKPSSLMLQPGNRKINYTYQNVILSFSIEEEVPIYEIVQISN